MPALLAGFLSDDWRQMVPEDVLVERFRLHRAVHDWLSTLSDRPLAVLIDDIHRADGETRALLAGLLDQGLAARVLFVLAYRPEPSEVLDDVLATAARYAPTRLRLAGLTSGEADELITAVTGTPQSPALVEALAARTGGNPFYLTESARLLASEGELVATSKVPEGVADVLRRRLARLPAESVSVLRLAAVIGRDVDVSLLVRAAGLDEEAVIDALEAGLISGMLVESGPGTVRFSHVLVRETLYAGIPSVRRSRWHGRVADAVAALYPADLTALAHHGAQAATAATARTAAEHCLAAAALAESRFAYDTAAKFYLDAQRCLELEPEPDVAAIVDVLVRRVPALMRAGATTTAARTRSEVALLAAGTGDIELLARAVTCGTSPTMRGNLRPYGHTDWEFIALVERVLAAPDVSPELRCLALTTLVRATSHCGDTRAEEAFTEALDLARTLGDPTLIGMALWGGVEIYPPDLHPVEREAIRLELEQLCAEHDLPVFHALRDVLGVNAAWVRLDLDEARRYTDAAAAVARRFQLRQGEFIATVLRATLEHASGDLDRAERLYEREFEEQRGVGTVDAEGAMLLAIATLRFTQGRLAELVDELRRVSETAVPAMGHVLALALAESGDLAGARRALDQAPTLERDNIWLLLTTIRALTVAILGDADEAGALYDALVPYDDQIAGAASNGFVLTPVARALGRLAMLLGRPQDARRHFEQARAVAQKCGSLPWLRQANADLGSVPAAG
jgi:tetratricopeptide (TPR) repeat protein